MVPVARALEDDVGCREPERLAGTSFLGDRSEDGEEGFGELFRVHSRPSLRAAITAADDLTARGIRIWFPMIYSHAMHASAARRRLRTAGIALALLLAVAAGVLGVWRPWTPL